MARKGKKNRRFGFRRERRFRHRFFTVLYCTSLKQLLCQISELFLVSKSVTSTPSFFILFMDIIIYFFLRDFSENRGIGKNNELPWKLKAELKHFANLTKATNNPDKKVIMALNALKSYTGVFLRSLKPSYPPLIFEIN